jgi:hypothetical protein
MRKGCRELNLERAAHVLAMSEGMAVDMAARLRSEREARRRVFGQHVSIGENIEFSPLEGSQGLSA